MDVRLLERLAFPAASSAAAAAFGGLLLRGGGFPRPPMGGFDHLSSLPPNSMPFGFYHRRAMTGGEYHPQLVPHCGGARGMMGSLSSPGGVATPFSIDCLLSPGGRGVSPGGEGRGLGGGRESPGGVFRVRRDSGDKSGESV